MIKAMPRLPYKYVVEILFPCMPKWRMTQIVPQGNGLNEIQVEAKHATNIARDAGYELHMEGTASDIVVPVKRKHLSFVRISIIIRRVDDFFHISRESRAPERGGVPCVIPPDRRFIAVPNLESKGRCTHLLRPLYQRAKHCLSDAAPPYAWVNSDIGDMPFLKDAVQPGVSE
jgi:hypothetical protein